MHVLLNKIDLLPYVDFDVDRFFEHAWQVNPKIEVIQLSATKGDGLKEWYDWMRQQIEAAPRSHQ